MADKPDPSKLADKVLRALAALEAADAHEREAGRIHYDARNERSRRQVELEKAKAEFDKLLVIP
jgi:hypothetical protein